MEKYIAYLLESGIFGPKKTIKRMAFLKEKDRKDTNLYFIHSGCLRVFVTLEEQEQILRFGYTGNLITSLDSFFNDLPSSYQIQAIRKTEVSIAKKQDFMDFVYQSPEHTLAYLQLLEQLVLQQLAREGDLLLNNPKERYNRVWQRSPKLFQEVPHKYIANYLRMSPETLSRLQKY